MTKSSTSEFWMSVNSGMKAAAEKYNMKVIIMSPDTELAKVLAEQLNHEGQVGIVAGDLKQKCHRERVEGFKEVYEERDRDAG